MKKDNQRDDKTMLSGAGNINEHSTSDSISDMKVSSFCGTGGCVGVVKKNGTISVYDTKSPERKPMVFTRQEWVAFTKGVKAGEFDL